MLIDDCGADVMLVMVTMWRSAQDIRRILLWLHPRCHGGKIVTSMAIRTRKAAGGAGAAGSVAGMSGSAGVPARGQASRPGPEPGGMGGEWGMGGLIQELLLKT